MKYKAIVNKSDCVACGCCVKVCPKNAINIFKGLFAEIKKDMCIGCKRCQKECPASVIIMEDYNEN